MRRDIKDVYESLGIPQDKELVTAIEKTRDYLQQNTEKGNNMEITGDEHTMIVEVIEETEVIEEVTESGEDLNKLLNKFQLAKAKATKQSAILTDDTTIKNMDSINEMVAEAMLKIGDFASAGQKEGFFRSKMTSTLAVIDPDEKWAAKWLDNSEEKAKIAEMNNKSITEVISSLVADIEAQRDSVITYIENAAQVKAAMEETSKTYEKLLKKAHKVLATAEENTRKHFDAQYLVTTLTASIESISTDIASHVNPLLAAANISVTQITTILPTIENDLQSKMGFKAFQQKLSDLNEMTANVANMSARVGETIRSEINDTVYKSIEMLGETGLDTDRMKKIADEEAKHQAKIAQVMNKTQARINQTFNDVQQLAIESSAKRDETNNRLLADYSQVINSSKGE